MTSSAGRRRSRSNGWCPYLEFYSLGCHKKYIGETGRGLKTRLTEHKRDIRDHRLSNAMVLHMEESDHLPRWDGASVLRECASRQLRRAVEAAFIRLEETTNTRAGFFTLSKYTAKIALQVGWTKTISVTFHEDFKHSQCWRSLNLSLLCSQCVWNMCIFEIWDVTCNSILTKVVWNRNVNKSKCI